MKPAAREVRAGHEHEFEVAPGLPEPLPGGERVLWQGGPDWKVLAIEAFHVRGIAVYLGALLASALALRHADGASVTELARTAAGLGLLYGFALGMLLLLAWLTARTALYTLTDRRVVMRVGIVLTLTFNLPLRRIAGAGLRLRQDGTGDIPLQVAPPDRIAIVHLWPHARPWRVGSPEPMLRCVHDAQSIAETLRTAWAAETGSPATAASPSTMQTAAGSGGAHPVPA